MLKQNYTNIILSSKEVEEAIVDYLTKHGELTATDTISNMQVSLFGCGFGELKNDKDIDGVNISITIVKSEKAGN